MPDRTRGTVDAPIDRHPHSRDKMAVRQGGREAITHWEVKERYAGADGKPIASLIDCRLETGRTHQIRVHLAHIGHPILGDETYATGYRTKAARLPEAAQAALQALGQAGPACLSARFPTSRFGQDRAIPVGTAGPARPFA